MKLQRTSLEMAGLDKKKIDAFIAEMQEKKIELHEMIIMRGDKVCYEAEWYPYEKEGLHMLYSLSKAFTAIGVGFAVQEGLLSVEDKVISFFDEELPEQVSERISHMTVEHLLTMCTGQEKEPPILNYEFEGNWVQEFLKIEPVSEPGTRFFYDTTATYVLSAIITKITGRKLVDYLKPRFFVPLGIEDYHWDVSPQGNSLGGIGLNVSIETVAKLGSFFLQQGAWQGKQLLDRAWMTRATARLVNSAGGEIYSDGTDWEQGYGYQIWQCIPEGVYRGDGAYGQFVVVDPKQNLVIATLAGTDDMGGLMDGMWKHLLFACQEVENCDIKEGESCKEAFQVAFPEGKSKEAALFGGTYLLKENEEGLKRIRLEMDKAGADKPVLCITTEYEDGKECTLSYGYQNWIKNDIPGVTFSHYYECDDIRRVNTAGAYAVKNSILILKLCYPNNPLGVMAELELEGETLHIRAKKSRCMTLKMEYDFTGTRTLHNGCE